MADHELIDDHERDRFEGTSAMSGGRADDRDEHDRPARFTRGNETDATEGSMAAGNDYERGRRDEAMDERDRPARFDRDDVAAESATERDRGRY
jgi:hypothetical protein